MYLCLIQLQNNITLDVHLLQICPLNLYKFCSLVTKTEKNPRNFGTDHWSEQIVDV